MKVGERITYFRQRKNITVNKLANLAGVSQSYLRDIERGNKQPTVEYLSYICNALGVTISQFFDYDETTDELTRALRRLNEDQKAKLVALLASFDNF